MMDVRENAIQVLRSLPVLPEDAVSNASSEGKRHLNLAHEQGRLLHRDFGQWEATQETIHRERVGHTKSGDGLRDEDAQSIFSDGSILTASLASMPHGHPASGLRGLGLLAVEPRMYR